MCEESQPFTSLCQIKSAAIGRCSYLNVFLPVIGQFYDRARPQVDASQVHPPAWMIRGDTPQEIRPCGKRESWQTLWNQSIFYIYFLVFFKSPVRVSSTAMINFLSPPPPHTPRFRHFVPRSLNPNLLPTKDGTGQEFIVRMPQKWRSNNWINTTVFRCFISLNLTYATVSLHSE